MGYLAKSLNNAKDSHESGEKKMAFKILPLFGRDKEKETVELFRSLLAEAKMANAAFIDCSKGLLDEDFDVVAAKAMDVSKHEKNADQIIAKIIFHLYGGAFLPGMRTQLHELAIFIDDVVDDMQNAANAFGYMRDKKFPESVKAIYWKLIEESERSVSQLQTIMEGLFENKESLMDDIKAAKVMEHNCDVLKKEVFDKVMFDKKLEPVTSRLLTDLAGFISAIADSVEDCCDKVIVLKLLRQA